MSGEDDSGFVEFLPQEKLRALWDEYGDKELFEWTEGDARTGGKTERHFLAHKFF